MYRAELIIMIRSLLSYRWYNNNHRIEPVTNPTANRIITGHQIQLKTMLGSKNCSEEIAAKSDEIIVKQENVAEIAK